MADFLIALADFDRQRAWAELGYSGLFWFLHRELKLSKSAAYCRKVAAEMIQKCPDIVAPLRDGRICLSSVGEVAKVLTVENVADVLPRFFHLSRREAAEVAAAIMPVERPPSRGVVTVVAASPAIRPSAATPEAPLRDNPVVVQPCEPLLGVTPRAPTKITPLTENLRRMHVTVSRRFLAKLDAARDALSHSHPGATNESILEAGLDLLLTRHRERRGIGAKPTRNGRSAAPGRVRAEVKRAVWARDGGCCQWPIEGGEICGSTLRLEFDHVVPRGRGGTSEAANIRLLCRFHNQFTARATYGDDLMDRFAREVPRVSEPVAPWRGPSPPGGELHHELVQGPHPFPDAGDRDPLVRAVHAQERPRRSPERARARRRECPAAEGTWSR